MATHLKRVARHSFDLLIFVALCLAVYVVTRWFEPYKRGFFCNDDSLRYPYHDGTISTLVLVVVVLALPGLVILVVELFKRHEPNNTILHAPSKQHRRKQQSQHQQQQQPQHSPVLLESGGYRLLTRLQQCYAQLGYYLFGLGLTVLCTQLTKRCVGRLRPHFFTVCQPMMPDGSSCGDAVNADVYVLDYSCAGLNYTERQLRNASQSFPSGHSSMMFYGMVYTAIYLQAMLSTRVSKLLKHLLQFIFILFAWYVALTRIADFMHHWTDVLAGAILGSTMAVYTAVFMTGLCWRRDFLRFGGRASTSAAAAAAACGNAMTLPSLKSAATTATPVLPAYTFGTLPYMQHPYAPPPQSYHNYGYVP